MNCKNCGYDNLHSAVFCVNCGKQIQGPEIDYNDVNKTHYVQTLVLFVCIVLVVVASFATNLLPVFDYELLFEGLLLLIVVVFGWLDIKAFIRLFRFRFIPRPFFQILIGAPLFAIAVSFLCDFFNQIADVPTVSSYELYSSATEHVFLYGFLFVAVLPGILEECLFRGILFNHLRELTGTKITIVTTAILFAIVHFSFFSLLWLFLVGLYAGYLRARYKTIVYGIFFHIWYNGSIFLLEAMKGI